MSFAEQLKSARQRLGLTQPEAAVLLDVSPSWIDKAEREDRAPHILMQEGALARLSAAVWYQAACSGLWYRNPKAAGTVSTIRADGVRYRVVVAAADDLGNPSIADRTAFACSAWLALAARWLEEARDRRTDMEEEKALGGRQDDATVGYCECLEDKAGELRKIGRAAEANDQDQRSAARQKPSTTGGA